ncbi:MAG: hypothetical protein JXC85_02005 [Candidatus Aenigmarchaeota archaeon]|nr:hypothetical protein [Candidatus Aenigmarchaeota archaeon]
MRIEVAALSLIILALLLSSGCLSYAQMGVNQTVLAGGSEDRSGPSAGEGAIIYVRGLSTDKGLYHSAEVMNLSITIESTSELEGVLLKARGIRNKLNMADTVNLSQGINTFYFTYKLPSCNVCGGIPAGTYDVSCEVIHGDMNISKTTQVELRQ